MIIRMYPTEKRELFHKKSDQSITTTAPVLLSEMKKLTLTLFNAIGYFNMYFFPFLMAMPLAID